jgi:hypothetical protein
LQLRQQHAARTLAGDPDANEGVMMKTHALSLVAAASASLLISAGAIALGSLENPQPGGVESGIAAITGWHCTSKDIEIRVDGVSIGRAGAGTPRQDTAATCGRIDTGFSLLYNYALLKDGTHKVDAYADGVVFGSATFQAGYLGSEFLTGLASSHRVTDFPARGQGTRVTWSQSRQGFVITGVEPLTGGALIGSYAVRNLWLLDSSGYYATTLAPGIFASGTWTYGNSGQFNATLTLTAGGQTSTESFSGSYSDGGYYIFSDGEFDLIVERGETLTLFTMGSMDGSVTGIVLSASRIPANSAVDAGPAGTVPTRTSVGGALRAMSAMVSRAGR